MHKIGGGSKLTRRDFPRKATLGQATPDHSCRRSGVFQKQVGESPKAKPQFLANSDELLSFRLKLKILASYVYDIL